MVRRTFDLLDRYKNLYGNKSEALAGKQNGVWVKYSSHDYISQSEYISYGLMHLGLKKGNKIAVVSNNRPEWNILDMGMAQAGIVNVPIYPTISLDDFSHILFHSEPQLLFVSDKKLYEKLKNLAGKVSSILEVYSFNKIEGVRNWDEILESGKDNAEKYINELTEIKSSIQPEDLATLIYTSGTTGIPKGVMISHINIVSNFISTSKHHPLTDNAKTLSFLPLCHIFERMMNYHFQYKGISIYYAENLGTIVDNLKEIQPHIFNTVPRLLEKIYDTIVNTGKKLPYIKRQIFFWALNMGLQYDLRKKYNWLFRLKLKLADKLVYSKWRKALGGNVNFIISGGATLQPRLARVFGAAKIQIIEGYGMTETSPVIAVGNPVENKVKIGTVGPILENVQVKIADDGEILCKGPNVMLGYYKDPEYTNDVIDQNGWFHTGDVGVFVDKIYLKITDRKKEIFKLSCGKYISPQLIENKFKESFFIDQIMIIGENEKFASAIISPNFSNLHNWCYLHKISFRDNAELLQHTMVLDKFQKEVNTINLTLGLTEQIKRFRLVEEEWGPLTGELSPTLKLKRKYILDKYSAIVDEIYSVSNFND